MKTKLFCILLLILAIGCSSRRPAKDNDDLIRAVYRDDVAALRALLEKGVDVNAKRKHDGATALWAASVGSHPDIIKVLLASGADVNTKNTDGVTALYVAAQNGHLENVKLLLESNVDVNVKRKTDSTTALWIAAHNGQLNIVKLLLESNADVNVKRKTDGVTALWITAAGIGHTEVVKLLLENKADVNAKASDGHTPLSIAKMRGHTRIIKLLKEYGAKD